MKKTLKKTITLLGLLSIAEKINFYKIQFQNRNKKKKFILQNPTIKLPPDFYLYETFGLNYDKYYYGGKETAEWIFNHLKKHINLKKTKVLDWGCGPARILRHVPNIIKDSTIFGSDYNKEYVDWCTKNIPNIIVKKNNLAPQLSFNDNYFNVIYSISIFTHLSEKMHHEWMRELNRVSKKDAVLFITTHGNASKSRLSPQEQINFDKGLFVEHNYKVEGNRLYASYQPKKFFKNLSISNGFTILEHIERGIINGKPTQDIWIIKKTENVLVKKEF